MPLKNGRLTPQERLFIGYMGRTGDRDYAATKAGYKGVKQSAGQLMQNPVIRAEVARQAEEVLFSELLPLALAAHKQLLTDKAVPAGARLGAVKLTYDRTMGAESSEGDDKEPSEMTAGELQRSIARLASELEGRPLRAKDVTPQPLEVEADDSPAGGVFD